MKYIDRTMEKEVIKASKNYPVVMVCDQRQVGKSTMLNHIKEANRKYVSLDDRNARRLAHEDVDLFFDTYGYTIINDEEYKRITRGLYQTKNKQTINAKKKHQTIYMLGLK